MVVIPLVETLPVYTASLHSSINQYSQVINWSNVHIRGQSFLFKDEHGFLTAPRPTTDCMLREWHSIMLCNLDLKSQR